MAQQGTPTRNVGPAPRLLRRQAAAQYLNISPSAFDMLRARGLVPTVVVPSEHARDGRSRVPLFDIADLDLLITRWKEQSGRMRRG